MTTKPTSSKMPSLLTEKQIVKEIDTIAHAVGGIGERIHKIAVQCLLHARTVDQGGTGDARLMDRLVKSLTIGADGKGRRKAIVHVEGIVAWCGAFSPIVWNSDGNVKMIKPESKDYKWDVAKAMRTPFWDVVGQAPVVKFSITAMLKIMAGLGKRLETAIEGDRFEGDVTNAKKVASTAEETAKRLAKSLGIDLNNVAPANKSGDTAGETAAKAAARRVIARRNNNSNSKAPTGAGGAVVEGEGEPVVKAA